MGLAGVTKAPEMALTPPEADMLADPLTKIMAEFNVEIDPKFELAISMISAASMVYGPRLYNINARLKREAAERAKRAGSGSVAMYPASAPAPVKAASAEPQKGAQEKPQAPAQPAPEITLDLLNLPPESHGNI